MTQFNNWKQGYETALRGVDEKLQESLTRHNVQNFDDALKVMNDIITHLHREYASLAEKEREQDIERFFGHDSNVYIIKGGINV